MNPENTTAENSVPPSAKLEETSDPQPHNEADKTSANFHTAINKAHRRLKITVATVTYNAGDLIARTIKSVEEQTYPYVEHLIVDGNSRDHTLEHVHHYQERNSVASVKHEIVCISEPDEGLYDAMNKAIGMASGKYILFLNAGDSFHDTDTLESIAKAAQAGKELPAVIYGDTHLVDSEGHFVRKRRLSPPEKLTWRSFSNGMLVCHQSFFARTDLACRNRYDRHYRFSADFDWCIRIMREAAKHRLPIVNARVVVSDYLNEGMTTQNHQASLRERFRIMVHHYGMFSAIWHHIWFVIRNFTLK